jgi:Ni/Co efflux regulator RcnB
MTTPATPAAPEAAAAPATDDRKDCQPPRRHCWVDDDDWHRGHTRVELPSERHMRAFWKAEILDYEARNPHTKIIETREELVVRFRVELIGRLWKCMCGHWCFNLGFTPFGDGPRFNLSDRVNPDELEYRDWKGCERLCVERCVRVPCDTIPTECCGIVYDVAAWFELRCCGGCRDKDSHLAVSGFERLGGYSFV